MNTTDIAIQNARQEISKIRAAREVHMAQRLEMQRKAEAMIRRPPTYMVRKYGGQQLTLNIGAGHANKTN
ncbi:hypothetical protein ACQZ4R_21040 [Agrobacterium vitis]